MEILFEIISHHKFSPEGRISHIFNETGGYIGRSNDSDWVLPDRLQEISRKHALISCDGNNFFLEDLSSNGIMSTLTRELVGTGQRHLIQHGDSFKLGQYVIQARLLRNPNSYLPTDLDSTVDESSELDPIVAMERQELREVRERMGFYDDFVSPERSKPKSSHDSLSDHKEAGRNVMLTVRAIPENLVFEDPDVATSEILSPHGSSSNHAPNTHGSSSLSPLASPSESTHTPQPENSLRPGGSAYVQDSNPRAVQGPSLNFGHNSEGELFIKTLGLDIESTSSEARQKLLILAAELLRASISGLTRALQNRATSQKELRLPVTTIEVSGNNPLKFSPSLQTALNHLFSDRSPDTLSPYEAIASAFNDLHSHHMGLLAGARAAMAALLDKLSPAKVKERLNTTGSFKLNKEAKLWKTYTKLHAEITESDALADFFLRDFARAYEMQVRVLRPIKPGPQEGQE
ncbi:MAG: type VI secretion system-associated FHA domain protein TagH [Deltaproteobacteria bacterium]|jgi:type VI secretion system protein ImpI|nr:type VI secretion system-associated FHA domain protein TagH [Deltaproteobacteria bacterium]